eukprot:490000_1
MSAEDDNKNVRSIIDKPDQLAIIQLNNENKSPNSGKTTDVDSRKGVREMDIDHDSSKRKSHKRPRPPVSNQSSDLEENSEIIYTATRPFKRRSTHSNSKEGAGAGTAFLNWLDCGKSEKPLSSLANSLDRPTSGIVQSLWGEKDLTGYRAELKSNKSISSLNLSASVIRKIEYVQERLRKALVKNDKLLISRRLKHMASAYSLSIDCLHLAIDSHCKRLKLGICLKNGDLQLDVLSPLANLLITRGYHVTALKFSKFFCSLVDQKSVKSQNNSALKLHHQTAWFIRGRSLKHIGRKSESAQAFTECLPSQFRNPKADAAKLARSEPFTSGGSKSAYDMRMVRDALLNISIVSQETNKVVDRKFVSRFLTNSLRLASYILDFSEDHGPKLESTLSEGAPHSVQFMDDLRALGLVHCYIGLFCTKFGNLGRALTALRSYRIFCIHTNDSGGKAFALETMAFVYKAFGSVPKQMDFLRQANSLQPTAKRKKSIRLCWSAMWKFFYD